MAHQENTEFYRMSPEAVAEIARVQERRMRRAKYRVSKEIDGKRVVIGFANCPKAAARLAEAAGGFVDE